MEKNAARSVRIQGARSGVLRGGRPHPTLIGTLLRAKRIREAIGVGEGSLVHGKATREECEILARAYWSLGMGRSAERLSKGLAEQRPPSLEGLILLGEIYAERMWAAQLQAVVRRLAREARWHPSLPELSRALETLGVEDTPPEGAGVEAMVGRAEWCLKRGWIGEAEGILKKVLDQHPRHARAQELLWGCRRERQLEARFGPLSPDGVHQAAEAVGASAQASQAGEGEADAFHIDTTRLSDMIEPTQVVEALSEEHAELDDDDDEEDDEEWEDDDLEDDDEDDDEDDLDTFSFKGGARLSISPSAQGGPSPLRERLRDQVIVIERGDRPRMIDGNGGNPKGLWFRGARDLDGAREHVNLAEGPGPVSLLGGAGGPPTKEPRITLAPSQPSDDQGARPEPKPKDYLPVGQYGFDDEDEGATEVVAKPAEPHRHRRVVSLLNGGDGPEVELALDDADQWDEGPTRAVVDEVLKQAFIDEDDDDPATRILAEKELGQESWEKEVETRVAGLDELDRSKHATPGEPTKALPGRGAAQLADQTAPLAPVAHDDETRPLPSPDERTSTLSSAVDLASSTTLPVPPGPKTVTAAQVRPRGVGHVLPMPAPPSVATSPALFVAVLLFLGLAYAGYSFQQSRYQERVDAVAGVVESMLLKGDAASIYQAQQTVTSALDPSEPDPIFDAMAARVAWARWVEVGGGSVLPPDGASLESLSFALGSNRDVMLATAYHDLFTRDTTRGVLRLEDALQANPEDPMLGAMLARMQLVDEAGPAVARQTLERATAWVGSAQLPAGPSGEALRPLLESHFAYVGLLIEYADGKVEPARKRLEELAFLNPSHPWIGVYQAALSMPVDVTAAESMEMLGKAQEALATSVAPRPRAWLLASHMDLATRANKLDVALGLADRVMTADPTWPEALYRSARAQAWRGDLPLALQRIQQAGELAPYDAEILEARVVLLLDSQEFAAAETLLAQLPPDMESEAAVWRARTEVALARRDPSVAEAHLKKAMAKEPNHPRTLLLQSQIGAIMEGKRKGRPPLETLLGAPETLELGVSHARLDAYLANLSSAGEARRRARAAIKDAPRDPVVREILAQGEESRGETAEAIGSLKDALKIAPSRVKTQVSLARLLAMSGDRASAQAYWDAAKDRCAEGPLCAEVASLMKINGPTP